MKLMISQLVKKCTDYLWNPKFLILSQTNLVSTFSFYLLLIRVNVVTCMSDCRRGLVCWHTLTHDLWLHFTVHYSPRKDFSVCCVFNFRCLVTASNEWSSPYSVFPNCPVPQLPAFRSNSSKRPNCSRPLTDCSLIKLLQSTVLVCTALTTCPGYNISARTSQNTQFLRCCSIVSY
jgi:hypothetical protein